MKKYPACGPLVCAMEAGAGRISFRFRGLRTRTGRDPRLRIKARLRSENLSRLQASHGPRVEGRPRNEDCVRPQLGLAEPQSVARPQILGSLGSIVLRITIL